MYFPVVDTEKALLMAGRLYWRLENAWYDVIQENGGRIWKWHVSRSSITVSVLIWQACFDFDFGVVCVYVFYRSGIILGFYGFEMPGIFLPLATNY